MSKYKAREVEYNGLKFDSKKEMKRYIFLKEMEDQKRIKDLKCQVKYVLIPSQKENGKTVERECSYIADFTYSLPTGETIVEDVKGYRKGVAYSLYTIKRKLMLYVHGIKVNEI